MELTVARIAKVAIMHVQDNGRRFPNMGFLQSLRSPARTALINATSYKVASGESRASIRKDAQGNPEVIVTLDYKPKRTVASTDVRTSRGVTSGISSVEATSIDVVYNLHREYTHNFTTYDMIKLTKETETYLKAAASKNISFSLNDLSSLAVIGDQLMDEIESILTPINTQCAATLVTHIGRNLVTGDSLPKEIQLYDANGNMKTDFFDFLNATKRVHGITGKLVVVGGEKAATYFAKRGIVAINQIGVEQAKMIDTMPIEFWYDNEIDVVYGQDQIIIQEPGAACYQSVLEHQYLIKQPKMANTTYGSMALSLAQYDAPTLVLDMDIRAKENDTAFPSLDVTPSIHGGIFLRPAGYFGTAKGWAQVTGTFGAKLI